MAQFYAIVARSRNLGSKIVCIENRPNCDRPIRAHDHGKNDRYAGSRTFSEKTYNVRKMSPIWAHSCQFQPVVHFQEYKHAQAPTGAETWGQQPKNRFFVLIIFEFRLFAYKSNIGRHEPHFHPVTQIDQSHHPRVETPVKNKGLGSHQKKDQQINLKTPPLTRWDSQFFFII